MRRGERSFFFKNVSRLSHVCDMRTRRLHQEPDGMHRCEVFSIEKQSFRTRRTSRLGGWGFVFTLSRL